MNAKRILPVALAFAILNLLTPLVEADSIPVEVPPMDVEPGYDWSSRIHSTKLALDATPLASLLDATNVTTPNIDLLVTSLMPWRSYHLTAGISGQDIYSDGFGTAVAWNLPAQTATWALLDGISGEPVTSFSVVGPPPELDNLEPRPTPQSGHILVPCSCYRYRPPQPEYSEPLEDGFAIVQGAYSFTPDVTIETSECYDHSVTLEAKATAGLASEGGTAGGAYTFRETICVKIVSRGSPKELLVRNTFKKDAYNDGSYKVYSIGYSTSDFKVRDPDLAWEPWDGTQTFEFDPSPHPMEAVITRSERSNVAVFYDGAVGVYGIKLGLTIRGTDAMEDTISMRFNPPSEGAVYRYVFVSEKESSGLVGVAWRQR